MSVRRIKQPQIKVPEGIVRTQAQILDGMHVTVSARGAFVWVTCSNCNGTGDYPSSMIPPGRCRLYCWRDRTPETYGKLPILAGDYVKKQQARDRADYRAKVRMEQRIAERDARLAGGLDARITTLAAQFGIDPANLPIIDFDGWKAHYVNSQRVSEEFVKAVSLVGQYVWKGELSEKQWTLAAQLPQWQAQRAQCAEQIRAAEAISQYVGSIGQRLMRELEVAEIRHIDVKPSAYNRTGRATIVTLRDDAGNLFIWWAGNSMAWRDKGWRGPTTFTVKVHEAYKGERHTVIQRVKFAKQAA